MTDSYRPPTLAQFEAAFNNVHNVTQRTPLETSRFLAKQLGVPRGIREM